MSKPYCECAVMSCSNNSTCKDVGITFYRFPPPPARAEWIRLIRDGRKERYWFPLAQHAICSLHFDESDFLVNEEGAPHIKKYAIPSKIITPGITVVKAATNQTEEDSSPTKEARDKVTSLNKKATDELMMEYDEMKETVSKIKSQMRSMRKKYKNLQETNRRLKIVTDNPREYIHKLTNCKLAAELFWALRNTENDSFKTNPAIQEFSMKLFKISPEGYKYVRRAFNNSLPSSNTVTEWTKTDERFETTSNSSSSSSKNLSDSDNNSNGTEDKNSINLDSSSEDDGTNDEGCDSDEVMNLISSDDDVVELPKRSKRD
ncbi:unnamed protein product [Plutella xylostella]|uniref:(diamondback moth) hypothetical protein n=1 Tax=Plutella xylostella TaxID=51655 RepID=A0A8S4FH69_PLUXY|nr:unnamed protein product [Plutella xylostella]